MNRTWFSMLFVATCLASLTCARVVRTPSAESPTRNRRQHNGNTNDQYGWVCPRVACPPLPDACQTIEFFVMEYDYSSDSGQTATIRCQSCEYCLDVPQSNADGSRRLRRNALHHRRHDCTTVSCPEVPSNCSDIRMTNVLLGNTKCRQCPACYDDTVFHRT